MLHGVAGLLLVQHVMCDMYHVQVSVNILVLVVHMSLPIIFSACFWQKSAFCTGIFSGYLYLALICDNWRTMVPVWCQIFGQPVLYLRFLHKTPKCCAIKRCKTTVGWRVYNVRYNEESTPHSLPYITEVSSYCGVTKVFYSTPYWCFM